MLEIRTTEKFNESSELDSYWIGAELSDLDQYSKREFLNTYKDLCDYGTKFSRTRRNFTLVQVADILKVLDAFTREKSARLTRVRLALIEANHRRSVTGKLYRINYRELAKLTNLSNVSYPHLKELVTHARTGADEKHIDTLATELKLTRSASRAIPRRVLRYLAGGGATRAEIGVLLSVYLRQMLNRLGRARISYKQITRLTGLSSRSIAKAFLKLKEKRLVLPVAEHNKLIQYNGKAYCLPKPEKVECSNVPTLGVGQMLHAGSVFERIPKLRKKRPSRWKKQCLSEPLQYLSRTYFFVKPSTKVKRQITQTLSYKKIEQAESLESARRVPDSPKPAPPTQSKQLCSGSPLKKSDEDRAQERKAELLRQAERMRELLREPVVRSEPKPYKPLEGDAVEARRAFLLEQARRLKEESS